MAVKNKYQREKQQISLDGGITWSDVTPPNYRKGRLIEIGSEECNIVYEEEYLTMEALEDGYIGFVNGYDISQPRALTNIAYSKNGGSWTVYDGAVSVSTGDKIRWKANGTLCQPSVNVYSTCVCGYHYDSSSSHFTSGGRYIVYGNPKSLLYNDNFRTFDETNIYVEFCKLFMDDTNLVSAENLAMPSNIYRCEAMFRGCTSLVTPPKELPAKTILPHNTAIEYSCYFQMFRDCTSLENAPTILAENLTEHCCEEMFYNCTSLVSAPDLRATTLDANACKRMFYGCTSLVKAPNLPATTLANSCYHYMFYGCTSLVTAPEIHATTLAKSCCWAMFENCSSLETAPNLLATTPAETCYTRMFKDCTNLNFINCQLASFYTDAMHTIGVWVENVQTTSGKFVYNCANISWQRSVSTGIPRNWTTTCT